MAASMSDSSSTSTSRNHSLQELFSPLKDVQLWPREGDTLLKTTRHFKKAPQAGAKSDWLKKNTLHNIWGQ